VLNGELVEDAKKVEGLGIEADMKDLLVGIDVLDAGGRVEA
jgi:hypothetical protein